jgi:SAM-dependent methyltransferase
MLREFLDWNKAASAAFDRLLPTHLRLDGNTAFRRDFLPRSVQQGDVVYELGGGSRPFISPERKAELSLRVVGLDINGEELAAAPCGAYDYTITHDLCSYSGLGDADVVICQATLEHVPDTVCAMRAIASTLRPGGRAFIFAPCRNAVFARLNMILPEGLKQKLLFTLFPHKAEGHDGFKAYYDHCTPSGIEVLARQNGLNVQQKRLFWISSYFTIFVPVFIVWRFAQLLAWLVLRDDAAETFIFVLQKAEDAN